MDCGVSYLMLDVYEIGGGKFDPAIAYSEDGLFILSFVLSSKRVNTVQMCGYRYICNDDASACSKYLESYEEGVRRNYELRQQLYEEVGLGRALIERIKEMSIYIDAYMFMINLFKQGSPLSFSEKRKEIKRLLFDNAELATAMKAHNRSGDNTMIKIYNACYATRSPLLTAIVYEILFKAKYSMKGIYHLMAKYLH